MADVPPDPFNRTPPDPSTAATDGDISLDYAAYITHYVMGDDAPLSARLHIAGLTSPSPRNQWTQAAWDGVADFWGGVWQGAKSAIQVAAEATTQYEQTKDALLTAWGDAKQIWNDFIEGRDLESETYKVEGRKLTSLIVSVRQAYEAIEKFRIGKLKDTVLEQIQRIEDQITLIEDQTKVLSQGAAAYGGRPSAGGLANAGAAINELQQVGGQLREIIQSCLDLVRLFDLLGTIEDDLGQQHLSQGKTEGKSGTKKSRRTIAANGS